MAAPAGNQFWKQRSTHGRKPVFLSPDDLWNACCEYFDWIDSNPLKEEKLFSYQGEVVVGEANKMRAMTMGGLYLFLDIHRSTWDEYKKKEDFTAVVGKVEAVIYEQKFTGAAADLLNPNIIARDLGLVDKKDLDIKNSGVLVVPGQVSAEEWDSDSQKT